MKTSNRFIAGLCALFIVAGALAAAIIHLNYPNLLLAQDPGTDADADGMTDLYEAFFGLDGTNPSDADAEDEDPISRTAIFWGNPRFTTGDSYGQTLLWDRNHNGPVIIDQSYVQHYNNGDRVVIYIAENSHATYFRGGTIDSDIYAGCGTQIQYGGAGVVGYDRIVPENSPIGYEQRSLSTTRIRNWSGEWGQERMLGGVVRRAGPPSPDLRTAQIEDDDSLLMIARDPVEFHNLCRKTELEEEMELR